MGKCEVGGHTAHASHTWCYLLLLSVSSTSLLRMQPGSGERMETRRGKARAGENRARSHRGREGLAYNTHSYTHLVSVALVSTFHIVLQNAAGCLKLVVRLRCEGFENRRERARERKGKAHPRAHTSVWPVLTASGCRNTHSHAHAHHPYTHTYSVNPAIHACAHVHSHRSGPR